MRGFHSAFAVCDNNKLRAFGIGCKKFRKALNVSIVKLRIYLVKDTEGRRLIAEQSEQQGDNRQSPLAA